MKLKNENQSLSQTTWNMVEEVAKTEIQANGKMLYISKNLLQMHDQKLLQIENYFDEQENNKSLHKIFLNEDGSRKTLIAKDFSVFTNKVLIPSLGQNLLNFQKDKPYEYRALTEVAPVVLFLLANKEFFKVEEMLIEPDNKKSPVEIELPWKMFKYDHLKDQEQIFKSNFCTRFFSKDELKKNYYTTFRGERGLVAMSKIFFIPKKVIQENSENAENSAFTKEIKKINDAEKGVIGAVETLTVVSPNATPDEKQNAEIRQGNEISQLKDVAIKSIKLISKTNSKKGYSALFQIYQEVVQALDSKSCKQYIKEDLKSTASCDFSPRVNNKPISITVGTDLPKYLSNLRA